ncbi:histidine phosphatase family protein [Streptomyces sp. NPDC007856]|uniref:histidine phosphatase family protein n=1 Tax=Streptomyces sp. NPDC007856 TaxID=3364781 RepID=UPI0036833901
MHIFLVRHGRDSRVPGSRSLSPEGLRQACSVGARLSGQGVTELWTSSLERARATAQAISWAVGLDPVVDRRLDEIRAGAAGIPDLPPPRERRRGPAPDGVESWGEFLERVGCFLSSLCGVPDPRRRIVLVTHSGVFDAVFEILCGTGARVELAVENCAVTRWEYRPGSPAGAWLLHGHNDTAHLTNTSGRSERPRETVSCQ